MQIETFIIGDIQTNCYIVYDETDLEGFVIDPGDESNCILNFIEKKGLNIKYIFLTHGHYDHTSVISSIANKLNCPVYLHKDDLDIYNMQAPIIKSISGENLYTGFIFYSENSEYKINKNLSVKIIFTPGHSKGCVCIELKNHNILFTGDTMFYGTYGRTDLPGGSEKQMFESLRKLISNFGGYRIYPGHGQSSNIDFEKENNDFIIDSIRH